MKATDEQYMDLHLVWRSEIQPTEDIQIDEAVFEEIYKEQEENNVSSKDRTRWL